jgi:hypothetical protein
VLLSTKLKGGGGGLEEECENKPELPPSPAVIGVLLHGRVETDKTERMQLETTQVLGPTGRDQGREGGREEGG